MTEDVFIVDWRPAPPLEKREFYQSPFVPRTVTFYDFAGVIRCEHCGKWYWRYLSDFPPPDFCSIPCASGEAMRKTPEALASG